jgi:hypothetical protein
LDYRLCRPSGGYGVRVPMDHLPGAILGSKDHRSPKIAGGDLFPAADLRVGPLYPTNVGQLGCCVLRYGLEVVDLAISVVRCAALLSLGDLLSPAHGRAEGVGEGHVFSMREELLDGLGVAFHELVTRELESFEYLVEIVYRIHLWRSPPSLTPRHLP